MMSTIEYEHLKPAFTRRIVTESAVSVSPGVLSQAIDVSATLDKNAKKPARGLPGYFTYGWKSASEAILNAAALGVTTISLRFVSAVTEEGEKNSGLVQFEQTLSLIQNHIAGHNIHLIVDPFGLALTQDGQWGLKNAQGKFDQARTYQLLEKVGYTLSVNRIHGVVTLGRIPEEVKMTRQGIVAGGGHTRIYSFSQNSETSTAYVYLDSPGHNTGQKILPGNIAEMDLWALMDIWHGADVSVIKPMESYHLMGSLRYFLNDADARIAFLHSEQVHAIAAAHPFIRHTLDGMISEPQLLAQKCERLQLAGYTVSGTTYMLSLLAHEKGPDMARARLEEMWLTALGVMGDRCACLIDRNAVAFLNGDILC
ncbi:hypothetical protein [uncultured Pantoea sp.]|uniref:hypothetical protein n=1 Tax=uncultured Pantoea sp. TaxID=218084 RepID=UPI003749A62F